jgi:hypothetical protein
MPDSKNQAGFSEQYSSTNKTEAQIAHPTPKEEDRPLEVDNQKYGAAKPKRTTIRAKISHDKRS